MQVFESQVVERRIAEQFRGDMSRAVCPPGSKLPPGRDLAKSLDVSGPSMREAFIALEVAGLPLRTEAFLTDWRPQGLALDCSYPPRDEPKNHNDWTTALTVIDKVKPQRAWLTHISHKLDAWLLETGASSPHAAIAMDGDRVDLPAGLDRPSS